MNFLKYIIENNNINPDFCNKRGSCGRCKVKLKDRIDINSVEKEILSKEEIDEGIILACQHDFTMDEINRLDYSLFEEGFSKNDVDNEGIILDFGKLSDIKIDKNVGYGIAIDIGTTTISMYLIDLYSGKILKKKSALNSQVRYGLDVFSRISHSIEYSENGFYELRSTLIGQLYEMIVEIKNYKKDMDKENINKITKENKEEAFEAGAEKNTESKIEKIEDRRNDSINFISISANCIMSHIVCNEKIDSMGKFPYSTKFTSSKILSLRELFEGCDNISDGDLLKDTLSKDLKVMVLPQVSAFIGGDVVSGIYSSGIYNNCKYNILFIDIGTNGEIVLSKRGRLSATSCATGPAFEGMNIKFGMRASSGAIENFKIEENGGYKIKVIGGKDPRGICGSGMLSIIREGVSHHLINKMGRIVDVNKLAKSDFRKNFIREEGKKRSIKVTEDIFLSQADIRQIQLSKAAISSAVRMIIEKSGLNFPEIDRVFIAGQFGSHLSEDVLVDTGILSEDFRGKIIYVGNTSQSGAYSYLLSQEVREDFEKISKSVEVVNLVNSEDYEKIFRDSMFFRRKIDE